MIIDAPIINGFWHGRQLSELEKISMNSFVHHGHKYRLWSYEKFKNTSKHIELRNAEEVVEKYWIDLFSRWDKKHKFQTFSNYFRYKLIQKFGGWWCDLDIVCLKRFPVKKYLFTFVEDIKVRSENQKIGLNYNVANGCFCCPKNCLFINKLVDYIEVELKKNKLPEIFGEWGTVLFSEAYQSLKLQKFLKPNWIGNKFSQADEQYNNPLLSVPNSHCVHFYNYLGTKEYKPNSLYDRMRKKYDNLRGVE